MRPRATIAVCVGAVGALVAPPPALAHWSDAPGPRTTAAATAQQDTPTCAPGAEAVTLEGTATPDDEGTYRLLPFHVADGTTRLEVQYDYGDADGSPGGDTVVDLGLWDADGTAGPDAFRGWGGSHHGVKHKGLPPIWIQADGAHRGFGGGPIDPGTWHVELGFGNVADDGGWYAVEVTCLAPDTGPPPPPDPVDPSHVADPEPGWYHGDFHMHARHSSPDGPEHAAVVANARDVGLDFLPITEYVTTWHQQTWGSVAAANPDLIVWPGREVITYDGHAIVLGETPNSVEYRHGFRQITMGEIQRAALADGASSGEANQVLFGLAHPTIFPEPLGDQCRGCHADYLGDIDPDGITTIEVLTGPVAYDPSYVGLPATPVGIEFPFMQTAIDLWEDLLLAGHRVTAVSGSDAKTTAGHGVNATAVYAQALSRPALADALRHQRAYVRTRGVDDSPELEMTATDGTDTVMIGGTLTAKAATLTITVRGAQGHTIDVVRNGASTTLVPVPTDPFTVGVPMVRGNDGGPLGTFYRVDVRDPSGIRSIVANPVWLAADDATPDPPSDSPSDPPSGAPPSPPTGPGGGAGPAAPDPSLPATGGSSVWVLGPLGLVGAWVGRRRLRSG